MPINKFYYVRHGQTPWNVEGRMQGNTNIPLNEVGVEQARKVSLPKDISLIVTSPMLRALETAAIIAHNHHLPIHIEPALKERGFGSFEGRLKSDILEELGLKDKVFHGEYLPDDAETNEALHERVSHFIEKWLEKSPEETILFVGHGAVFRGLCDILLGRIERVDNAKLCCFEKNEGEWELLSSLTCP